MRKVPTSALQDTLPVLKAGSKRTSDADSDDSDAEVESKRGGGSGKGGGGSSKSASPSKKRVRMGDADPSMALVAVDSDDENPKVPLAGVLRQQQEQQEEIDELRAELAKIRTEATRRASNASSIAAPLLISDSDGETSGMSNGRRGFLDSEESEDDDDDKLDPTCCCGLCCRCCGSWNLKVLYLAVANVVVLALGLIILIMAVVAMKNEQQFKQILPVAGIYAMLGTGVVTVLAAPGGTFCATRHKSTCGKMGLVVYCGLLLLLVIAQAGTGILMTTQSIMLKKFHVNSKGEVSGAKKGLNAFLQDVCQHCCQNATELSFGGDGVSDFVQLDGDHGSSQFDP